MKTKTPVTSKNGKPLPPQLQIAFTKTQQKQNDLASKRYTLKRALADVPQWEELTQKAAEINLKRKQILLQVKGQYPELTKEIEYLEVDLKDQKEMMTDIAIRDLHDGQTVAVQDEEGTEYEPVWSVRFKRANRSED